jgi:hypothetical protein
MPDTDLTPWTRNRVDLLAAAPEWQPNTERAFARHIARAEDYADRRRRRVYRLAWCAAATVAVCIAIPLLPPTAALAQRAGYVAGQESEQLRLWLTLFRRGPELARSEPGLPVVYDHDPGPPRFAADLDQASALAGFSPHLPTRSTTPTLAVRGEVATSLDWQGARLGLRIPSSITATWPDAVLDQAPQPVIHAPEGFDLTAFTAAALRATLMGNPALISRLSVSPSPWLPVALLAGYRPHLFASLREVNLRTARATLVEEWGTRQGLWVGPPIESIALVWADAGRAYVLRMPLPGEPVMLSSTTAGAIARAIDLANAIP